jgi:hypothetical protein
MDQELAAELSGRIPIVIVMIGYIQAAQPCPATRSNISGLLGGS